MHFLPLELEVRAEGFGVGELPVEVREDRVEADGIRRQVGHAFDSMHGRSPWHPGGMDDAGRYRLTLTLPDQLAMSGWWDKRIVARRQFSSWVGERGSLPGVRIELVDTETGTTLADWPAEA